MEASLVMHATAQALCGHVGREIHSNTPTRRKIAAHSQTRQASSMTQIVTQDLIGDSVLYVVYGARCTCSNSECKQLM